MLRRLPVANPQNRWERAHVSYESGDIPNQGLQLFLDDSRRVISENDSPDVSFRFSLNPYRGCAHGCAYCYARPSHEYLGFGSGTDFERRLLIKPRAAELLREAFEAKGWLGDLLVLSGNTDCYQPIEAQLGLTRGCLEVCVEYRNPVHIITKGSLVERDLELLVRLHEVASVSVSVSIPFWDPDAARSMEPYAPPPARRIETIRRLSSAGIPVVVNVAPLIPGLVDADMIPILEAARAAGALSAMSIPVRLPGSVAQVFQERLHAHFPGKAEKVLARIREMRGGALNEPRFHERMRAKGEYGATLFRVFQATCTRLGFGEFPEPRIGTFRRPKAAENGDNRARARRQTARVNPPLGSTQLSLDFSATARNTSDEGNAP
ncbi:MAG TPA: PA0069 family radical SAM protein [Polyangiaceae bacterium]|nr:PA0069 family radical SAM protein [Polyangiaceae bacterium]